MLGGGYISLYLILPLKKKKAKEKEAKRDNFSGDQVMTMVMVLEGYTDVQTQVTDIKYCFFFKKLFQK